MSAVGTMQGEGAESDNVSTASGSTSSNNGDVMEDPNFQMEPDSTFEQALDQLDELKLEPDTNLPETGSLNDSETHSAGGESTGSKEAVDSESANGTTGKKVKIVSEKDDDVSNPPNKISKKQSLFNRLKRLTKFEKSPKSALKSNFSKFRGVRVDKLPVCFVAKYIGHKEVKGVYGLEHVRGPVDDLISQVKDDMVSMDRVELPLCYMIFSSKGIDIRAHNSNKVQGDLVYGMHPIDFISYGVQDMRYWRVFTFIVVKELSSRQKKTECHVFIADSTQSARKMALALSACFSVYKKKLSAQGKFHNFQVELRPPDELANDFEKDIEA